MSNYDEDNLIQEIMDYFYSQGWGPSNGNRSR